jgi:hypothetical protein
MASSGLLALGLRVGCSLWWRAFFLATCDRGSAGGSSCFFLRGEEGAGHPVYQRCSELLAEHAFRVRGSASFGSVSRAAAHVAQVPLVLLGGACLPHVPNLQPPEALQRSTTDGIDRRYRPSYGDFTSLGHLSHCPGRASHPQVSKTVSSAADPCQLDVLRLTTTLLRQNVPDFPVGGRNVYSEHPCFRDLEGSLLGLRIRVTRAASAAAFFLFWLSETSSPTLSAIVLRNLTTGIPPSARGMLSLAVATPPFRIVSILLSACSSLLMFAVCVGEGSCLSLFPLPSVFDPGLFSGSSTLTP